MALYTMAEKKTFAVFLKTRRNQRDVLVRERYNIVQYGTDSNALTFIEGLPAPEVRQVANGVEGPAREEVYDEIRVYDGVPGFLTRFGKVS
jgi:hypothetical protein